MKPSSNYNVEEDTNPKYNKMIKHKDDLPNLINDLSCLKMRNDA
jgi:hypothetical protein